MYLGVAVLIAASACSYLGSLGKNLVVSLLEGLLIKFIEKVFSRCSYGARAHPEDLCFSLRHFYDVLLGIWRVLFCALD